MPCADDAAAAACSREKEDIAVSARNRERADVSVITYSMRGADTAERLIQGLGRRGVSCRGYLYEKYRYPEFFPFGKAEPLVKECFEERKGLIFVCASGIALRQISPFVKSKLTDAPVVVMDEAGRFAIPVLSGHMGGANELARCCAEVTGAEAVITTATDIHGSFAVDEWARKHHFVMENAGKAKEISAAVLAGRPLEIVLSEELSAEEEAFCRRIAEWEELCFAERFSGREWGILVSPFREQTGEKILQLIPKILILGIGCKKGTAAEKIERAVCGVLEEYRLERRAAAKICSIDLKREERGLLQFADEWELAAEFYSAGELSAQAGSFVPSEFVRGTTGVDNVCERSVMAGGARRLLVPKQRRDGVTVAVGIADIF